MTDTLNVVPILNGFTSALRKTMAEHAQNPDVACFKSIVCYRTGLDVSMYSSQAGLKFSLLDVFKMLQAGNKVRLAHKDLNDLVVRITLEVAGEYQKPGQHPILTLTQDLMLDTVQFHTGLGDSDINLLLSSPTRLQQVIRNYPETIFVILHSSYPYTREAGYLAAVYSNVYLDFGEVRSSRTLLNLLVDCDSQIFPVVSSQGQKAILSQLLELTPTNKLLWSSKFS